jgi:hypothetical protein
MKELAHRVREVRPSRVGLGSPNVDPIVRKLAGAAADSDAPAIGM